MNLCTYFAVLASFLLASSYGFDVETELVIDNLVENVFMRNNRISGLGLSVVRNGEVLMSKGYGMKNIEAGLASDDNTLFAIGSITKTFIATLVVKTLNEIYPQLDVAVLDVPLVELIPPTFNFTLSDRFRAESTTFRDLLAHRTCLMTGEIDLIFGTLSTASEYAYRSRFLPQVCDFRNGFVYNNNMISLAGEIIAAIAEKTLPELLIPFVRDLGMANTTYIDVDGNFASLPDMSLPYVIKDDELVEFDMNQIRKFHMALGAGGMLSTASDMTKFMNFHLNLGRVGDEQIVPENVMRWLYTVSNPLDFQGDRTEDSIVYGELGLSQGSMASLYDGWGVIYHGGYLPPYHCDMRLFPATKIGVFNCASGPGVIYNFPSHEIVAYSIFELVRGTTQSLEQILYKQRNIGKPFVEHQMSKGAKTTGDQTPLYQIQKRIEPDDVLGLYGHPYHGVVTITYEPETDNATLLINFSEFAIGRLHPVPGVPTTFSVEWITGLMDHFYTYPWEAPGFWVDFGIADTVLFIAGELHELYAEFEFIRNATLDTFPSIPWAPTSCRPE